MTTRAAGAGMEDTSASRAALVEALRRGGRAMTVQELADAVGLHTNSVRFHLARLIQAGAVREERSAPTGPGRPRLVYSIATGAGGGEDGYQLLAEALSEHLAQVLPDPDEVAIRAGEQRARRMMHGGAARQPATEAEGRELVTALMREYGFDPEWDPDGERLWLRNCPLRPLSDREPSVTCSVHLGLLRGTLDAAATPLEVTSLDPAPAPQPCLARFRRTPPADRG